MSAYSDAVLADSPVAYWRLGASPLVDASGNGNTLTVQGTAPPVAASLIPADTDDGSRDFNTAGFYSAVSTTALELHPPRSMEMWITPDSWNWVSILRKFTHEYGVTVPNGPAIRYFYHDGTTFQVFDTDSGSISLGSTYHVVITDNGTTTIRAYINSVQVKSWSRPNSLYISAPSPPSELGIGAYWGTGYGASEFFDGRIDEIALYATALDPTRVTAHYVAAQIPSLLTWHGKGLP